MLTCPNCGASLQCDDTTKQMICEVCGEVFDPDTSIAIPEELPAEAAAGKGHAGRHLKKTEPASFSFGPKRFLVLSLALSVPVFLLLSLFLPMTPTLFLVLAVIFLLAGSWICSLLMRSPWMQNKNGVASLPRVSLRRSRKLSFFLTAAALLLSAAVLFFAQRDSRLFYYAGMLDAAVLFFRFAGLFRFRLLLSRAEPAQARREGGEENV